MTVPRLFFGHMVQGELLTSPWRVTIPFGLFRVWDNGASYEWVYKNNWEGFDNAVAFGVSKGVDILYVCAGVAGSIMPPIEEWRLFVARAVDRAAGRVKYWQTLNEPAYLNMRPSQALLYAREAEAIIRGADPRHVIVSPSFNELQKDYERGFARDYIDEMASLGGKPDVVAFHSYSTSQMRDLEVLLSLLEPHGLRPPIWLTETVATPDQLRQLARGNVQCVVQNAQIEGRADYSANEGLGLDYARVYAELTAPDPPRSWWKKLIDLLFRRT